MTVKDVLNEILCFIFPKKCVCCSKHISAKDELCEDCEKKIERVGDKICIYCGQPLKDCECKFRVCRFRGCIAPFFNIDLAQRGFYDFKFRKRLSNSKYFAKCMVEHISKHYANIKFDAVCYVPMYYFDACRRGYNQSEILAKQIARSMGIVCIHGALYKHKTVKNQHKTETVPERYDNVRKMYYTKRRLGYNNVLLIDDIKTTGATLDECSRQLMLAGVNNVYCATALITNKRLKKEKTKAIIEQKSGELNGN